MSRDLFEDVRGSYAARGFIDAEGVVPRPLPDELARERINFLAEELFEYKAAVEAGDLAGQADALVDLVVVALGTAALQGLPFAEHWEEVKRANDQKVVGAGRHHGHRPGADLVKPPGWRAPDHAPILAAHGYVAPQVKP